MSKDIGQQAVRGAAWLGGGQLIRQILALATNIALARMLFPDDFGLFALALAAAQIAQILSDFGLGAAIIQRQEKDRTILTTCFWITLAVGALIGLALILGGPLLASFYGREEVALLVFPLALNMLICSAIVVPQATLTQDLKFREITTAQIIGSITASIGAITLAINGAGVWALASQPVIGNLVTGSLLFYFSPWRPKGRPQPSKIKGMIRFSSQVLFMNLVSTIGRNLHAIILGKQLNTTALGYYGLASGVTGSVIFQISSVIVRVMFPTIASIKNEPERIYTAWSKASSSIAIITLPTMAGIIAVAPDLVPVVFGQQWIPAIDVLQILCIVMAVQSVLTTSGTILLALGRSDILLRITLTTVPLIGAALFYGSNYGIEGAAIGYTTVNVISYFVTTTLACREINASSARFFLNLTPWLLASIVMAIVVSTLADSLINFSPWLRLSTCILLGAVLYSLLLVIFIRKRTFLIVTDITSRLRG